MMAFDEQKFGSLIEKLKPTENSTVIVTALNSLSSLDLGGNKQACRKLLDVLARLVTQRSSEQVIAESAVKCIKHVANNAGSIPELLRVVPFLYSTCFIEKKNTRDHAVLVLNSVSQFVAQHCSDAELRNSLRNIYELRLPKMVLSADPKFAEIFGLTVDLFGKNLHTDVSLLNSLLKCEENALKVKDPAFKIQALYAWKKIINSFACVKEIIRNVKRINLLMLPLLKSEELSDQVAATKLDVWEHLLTKLSSPILHFSECVIKMYDHLCSTIKHWPLLAPRVSDILTEMLAVERTRLPVITNEQFAEHSLKIFKLSRDLLGHGKVKSSSKTKLASLLLKRVLLCPSPAINENLKEFKTLVTGKLLPQESIIEVSYETATEMKECAEKHIGNNILFGLYEEFFCKILEFTEQVPPSKRNFSHLEDLAIALGTCGDQLLNFISRLIDMVRKSQLLPAGKMRMWHILAKLATIAVTKTESCNEKDQFSPSFATMQHLLIFPFSVLNDAPKDTKLEHQALNKEWKELYKLIVSTVELEIRGSGRQFREDLLVQTANGLPGGKFSPFCACLLIAFMKEAFEVASRSKPEGKECATLALLLKKVLASDISAEEIKAIVDFVKDMINILHQDSQFPDVVGRMVADWERVKEGEKSDLQERVLRLLEESNPILAGSVDELQKMRDSFENKKKQEKIALEEKTKAELANGSSTKAVSVATASASPSIDSANAVTPQKPSKGEVKTPAKSKTPKAKKEEEFVVIPVTPKSRILTERQKEKMKQARVDIPAMYNDYSQDSELICHNSSQSQSLLSRKESSSALSTTNGKEVRTPSAKIEVIPETRLEIQSSPGTSITKDAPKDTAPLIPATAEEILPKIAKILSPVSTTSVSAVEKPNLMKTESEKKSTKKRKLDLSSLPSPEDLDDSAVSSPFKIAPETSFTPKDVSAFCLSDKKSVSFILSKVPEKSAEVSIKTPAQEKKKRRIVPTPVPVKKSKIESPEQEDLVSQSQEQAAALPIPDISALLESPIRNPVVPLNERPETSPTWDSHPVARSLTTELSEASAAMEVTSPSKGIFVEMEVEVSSSQQLDTVLSDSVLKAGTMNPAVEAETQQDEETELPLRTDSDMEMRNKEVERHEGAENKKVKEVSSSKKTKVTPPKVPRELLLLAQTTGPNEKSERTPRVRSRSRKSASQPILTLENLGIKTPGTRRMNSQKLRDGRASSADGRKGESQPVSLEVSKENQKSTVTDSAGESKVDRARSRNVPTGYVDTPRPRPDSPMKGDSETGYNSGDEIIKSKKQPSGQSESKIETKSHGVTVIPGRSLPQGYVDTPRPTVLPDAGESRKGYDSEDEIFSKLKGKKKPTSANVQAESEPEVQSPLDSDHVMASTSVVDNEDTDLSTRRRSKKKAEASVTSEEKATGDVSSVEDGRKYETEVEGDMAALTKHSSPASRRSTRLTSSLDIEPSRPQHKKKKENLQGSSQKMAEEEETQSLESQDGEVARKGRTRNKTSVESVMVAEDSVKGRLRSRTVPSKKLLESPLATIFKRKHKNDLHAVEISDEEEEQCPEGLMNSKVKVSEKKAATASQESLEFSSESEDENVRRKVDHVLADLQSPPEVKTKNSFENSVELPHASKASETNPGLPSQLEDPSMDTSIESSEPDVVPSSQSTHVQVLRKSSSSGDDKSSEETSASPINSSEVGIKMSDQIGAEADASENDQANVYDEATENAGGITAPETAMEVDVPETFAEKSEKIDSTVEQSGTSSPKHQTETQGESMDIFQDTPLRLSPRRTPRKGQSPSKPVEKEVVDSIKCNLSFETNQDEVIPSSLPEKAEQTSTKTLQLPPPRQTRNNKSVAPSGRGAQMFLLAQNKGKQLEDANKNVGATAAEEESTEKENEVKLLSPSKPWKRHSYSPSASPSSSILKRKLDDPSDVISPPPKSRKVTFSTPEVSEQVQIPRKEPGERAARVARPKRRILGKQDSLVVASDDETSELATELRTSEEPATIEPVKTPSASSPRVPPLPNINDSQDSTLDTSLSPSAIPATPVDTLERELPIFPELVDCKDDVSRITCSLTSGPWVKMLARKLKERKIVTVGDLCALPERVVHELDIQPPKIAKAKAAMQSYYAKWKRQNVTEAASEVLEISRTESLSSIPVIDWKLENKRLSVLASVPAEKEMEDISPESSLEIRKNSELISSSSSPKSSLPLKSSLPQEHLTSEVTVEKHSVQLQTDLSPSSSEIGLTTSDLISYSTKEIQNVAVLSEAETSTEGLIRCQAAGVQNVASTSEIATGTEGLIRCQTAGVQSVASTAEMATGTEGLVRCQASGVQNVASTAEVSTGTEVETVGEIWKKYSLSDVVQSMVNTHELDEIFAEFSKSWAELKKRQTSIANSF